MNTLVWLVIGVVAFLTITHFMGKPDFWKATAKHPQLAWRFFNEHPAWFINDKPLNIDVVGPFRFANPNNGELTKIWCDAAHIEKSQEEFMSTVKGK